MQSKQLKEELMLVDDFKALANAYEQISVMKMQQVRSSVLSTRIFMEGLSDVFYNVKTSYKRQIEALMKKNKKQYQNLTFSTIQNNGKEIVILFSANAKLYGDIVAKTFSAFLETVKNQSVEIAIVGALGKELFDEYGIRKDYTYFQIPDTNVTTEDLKALIEHAAKYQTVRVFYGKFENVISQTPNTSIVSGQEALVAETDTGLKEQQNFQFFFEPSLENILHFFETQLFSSLIKQTVHENELARFASRIKAMEEAIQNIHNRKGSLEKQQKRLKNTTQNKKQLAALSGMKAWSGI